MIRFSSARRVARCGLVAAAVWCAAPAALAAPAVPRIVNGIATTAYPSVGFLLLYDDSTRTTLSGFCSGTLVGCDTFVTAAHCVCAVGADGDAASCLRQGLVAPATMQVFLQHVGLLDVAADQIHPDFNFAVAGDIAILRLAAPVTGIAPAAINTARKPPLGTRGTLVGYGVTLGGRRGPNDGGIKRQGKITLAGCGDVAPDDVQICWQFAGPEASTCDGDSGGPLFVDLGDGPVLAGVTSGGVSARCVAPDVGFDTDVFSYHDWISQNANVSSASCGDLPAVGSSYTQVFQSSGSLSASSAQIQFQFSVPAGTTRLRVVFNGQALSGTGQDEVANDFDLFVRSGTPPTDSAFDCSDENPTSVGSCEFADPTAGPWYAVVKRVVGEGALQITATAFTTTPTCVGDCNGDGRVGADELVTGSAIAEGDVEMSTCPVFDVNLDGVVDDDELLAAIHNAFAGCPR